MERENALKDERTIDSLEQSLIAQQEAARHYYNLYFDLRKVVFEFVDMLENDHTKVAAATKSLFAYEHLKEALK
jgi:hypothetical protein